MDVDTLLEMAADEEVDMNARTFCYQGATIFPIEETYSMPNPFVYTADEQSERGTLYTDITNYIKTTTVSFISGEKDINSDAEWNGYVNQIKTMGYDRLMEIETAAWNRQG